MSALFTRLASPVGDLLLAGDERELRAIWIDGQRWAPEIAADWRAAREPFAEACRQLEQYFAGERTAFELPLHLGGTSFQIAVWSALCRIPFGETRSYAEVARAVGRPGAARAVGAANGRNPLCIVVPCHRLLGSDGALVDYAAGLDAKRWLLGHEDAVRRGHTKRPGRAGE